MPTKKGVTFSRKNETGKIIFQSKFKSCDKVDIESEQKEKVYIESDPPPTTAEDPRQALLNKLLEN